MRVGIDSVISPCVLALTDNGRCSARRNEIARQAELKQQPGGRGPITQEQKQVTPADRAVTVSWLMEVVSACGLQPATLFLAVSYMDRFLGMAQVKPL